MIFKCQVIIIRTLFAGGTGAPGTERLGDRMRSGRRVRRRRIDVGDVRDLDGSR